MCCINWEIIGILFLIKLLVLYWFKILFWKYLLYNFFINLFLCFLEIIGIMYIYIIIIFKLVCNLKIYGNCVLNILKDNRDMVIII